MSSGMKRFIAFIAAVVIGFVVWSGLANPVHEFGHLVFTTITGGSANITSAHGTHIETTNDFQNWVGTMGGVWMETLVYLLMARLLWNTPFRWAFLVAVILGPWGELVGNNWNYGISVPDHLAVKGFGIGLLLWQVLWAWVILSKKVSKTLDKRKHGDYNYEEWQAEIRRRAEETRKNLAR